MKEKTISDLFYYYFGHWVVKLGLDKKYQFVLKQDNRISDWAFVQQIDKTYVIKFNTKNLKTRWKVIQTVLHELNHISDDFRESHSAEHEFRAEYFSLKTAKEFYPQYYKQMVQCTKNSLKKKNVEDIHYQGYKKALKKLGEL